MIDAEADNYPVAWMCAQLDVPRSSFYAWRTRVGTLTYSAARREELKERIKAIYQKYKGTYGCRRIAAELNGENCEVSVGLVAKLMRELALAGIQRKAYKRTTVRDEDACTFPDLLGRNFAPGTYTPGQALVGDITYLRTGQGWVYLAVVIDLATRLVVGWQMASHMRTSLVRDALQMAIDHGRVKKNAIIHTDHGSQYTSGKFQRFCKKNKIRQSMGRTGVCWDNSVAESFFASLKNEMYYQQVFHTRTRARFAVMEYIEVFYNRQRRHSTLGYRTPTQAWDDHPNPAAAKAA